MVWLILSTAAGLVVGVGAAWVVQSRRRTSHRPSTDERDVVAISSALSGGESIYLPTGRPDEFVVYSADAHAVQGVAIPKDLAQTAAATVSTVLKAGIDAAKASGRLVMVDGATAKAIREGALATDKAGKSLAVVKGAGGKFEHLARLSPTAGKAAGTAMGAANVLGAVSTQMQMAAIEAKLSEIVEVVGTIETVQRRELDSSIFATRQLVGEVVGASREAGFLPAESWAQIAPHYKSIIQDQQMAIGAATDLINSAKKSPKGFWLDTRSTNIQTNRELLQERLQALKEADLNAMRMHIVRLWHYTVNQPELASYFENLARQEVENQRRTEADLIALAEGTISQHGELAGISKIFHWSKRDDYRQQVEEFSRISPIQRPDVVAIDATALPAAEVDGT